MEYAITIPTRPKEDRMGTHIVRYATRYRQRMAGEDIRALLLVGARTLVASQLLSNPIREVLFVDDRP